MHTVRVGVIGCGAIAEYVHLPAYKENPMARLIAVCDINKERAKKVAEAFEAESWYIDYKELLKRDDIDAVSICTPNHLHCEQAVAAAEAGKHILLEKPMALTLRECDEIINACKKSGVKLMIGTNSKFDPVYQRVKTLIDQALIGKILIIKHHMAHSGPYKIWPAASDWFFDKDKVGGGCLMDLGSHAFDLLRWLAGDVTSVMAIGGAFIKKDKKMEDNALVLLTFKEGMLGEADFSWTYKGGYEVTTEIIGTEGAIFVETPRSPITMYSEKIPSEVLKESKINVRVPMSLSEMMASTKRKIDHFIECIAEDKEPIVTGEDGRAAVEIILAAYESMKTGKRIHLPLKY